MDELFVDQTAIDNARREGEKQLESLSSDEIKYLRKRAKNDLFFLAHGILGYKKLSPNLHGHLCSWMQKNDNEQFREILLPRGHYKSTVVTISDSIRIALPDDAGDSPWPRNLGPNARILLGHETHDMAGRFLFSIVGHFTQNSLLISLFPECIPNPKKQRINKYELELPRSEIWSEPTFDTMGVGGRSQGRHYNFLKLDDIFGDKARDSEAERKTTVSWFDNTQSFFSTFGKDHLDLVGTRWALDDIYAHAHEVYEDELKKYIRGVEELNEQGERVPIFPEEFTSAKLRILRKNRIVFSAQYANNPKEGSNEWTSAWLKKYHWVNSTTIQSFGGPRLNIRSDLDIVFLIDPAVNGLGAFLVVGTDERNNHYLLLAEKKLWKQEEFVEDLFKRVQKFLPRVVGIEDVLFMAIYDNWLKLEMKVRGIRFKIEPLKTKNQEKPVRIRAIENELTAGQIYVTDEMVDFIEEVDSFGATENIHLLDAFAYGPRVWKTGVRRAQESNEKAVQVVRDIQTGYSPY